jgi:hypothetical protein
MKSVVESTSVMATIPTPEDTTITDFQFSVKVGYDTLLFKCTYRNEDWCCFVTMPDETIRYVSLKPNMLSWRDYPDYGIILVTSDIEITQSNIFGQTLLIMTWST